MTDLFLIRTASTRDGNPLYLRPHGNGLTPDTNEAWRVTEDDARGFYIYGTEELVKCEP